MQDDCITIALGLSELRVVGEEETDRDIKVEVGVSEAGGHVPSLRADDG